MTDPPLVIRGFLVVRADGSMRTVKKRQPLRIDEVAFPLNVSIHVGTRTTDRNHRGVARTTGGQGQRPRSGDGLNYYQPRELADHSGWHYTCRNDDRINGVGYDGRFQTCLECLHQPKSADCPNCGGKQYIEAEPHAGHATREDAYACATSYALDTATWNVHFDTTHSVPRCELPGCTTLVEDGGGASWGFGMPHHTSLCPEHRNRESLAQVVGQMGDVMSS